MTADSPIEARAPGRTTAAGCGEENYILHKIDGCTVERRGTLAIKSGPAVTLAEGKAQQLAESLGLPVPHIHCIEPLEDGYSITMDYVPGERLDKVWETMSLDEKHSLCAQLKTVLTTMHACTDNPTGTIGSCDGTMVQDLRRYSTYTSEALPDEAAFNAFLLDLIKATPQPLAAELGRRLSTDHQIVFTHADLAQHNIIMQDKKLAAIIDWQFSGWYPEWWEYIKFFERFAVGKDWKDMAHEIFPQTHDKELVDYQALIRWQYP